MLKMFKTIADALTRYRNTVELRVKTKSFDREFLYTIKAVPRIESERFTNRKIYDALITRRSDSGMTIRFRRSLDEMTLMAMDKGFCTPEEVERYHYV